METRGVSVYFLEPIIGMIYRVSSYVNNKGKRHYKKSNLVTQMATTLIESTIDFAVLPNAIHAQNCAIDDQGTEDKHNTGDQPKL